MLDMFQGYQTQGHLQDQLQEWEIQLSGLMMLGLMLELDLDKKGS